MGFIAPDTVPEALQRLADGNVRIIAGCTDYFPTLGERLPAENLMDITALGELRGISSTDAGWSIGAATTWSDIAGADLPAVFDALKGAAREVGSVQIQNAATMAGNLCNASPAADGVPPLLTLNARVELRSLNGRRMVALADFITGVRKIDLRADELVSAIHVPALPANVGSHFVKLGARSQMVISIAMVSALVALDDAGRIETARVAVGACSAVARRLGGLEAALVGCRADALPEHREFWTDHLGELDPITDVRASCDYRLAGAGELCKRAVLGAIDSANGASGG